MDELLTIVNDNDIPVGIKLRSAITPCDIYRVAALLVYSRLEDGGYKVLLAQRSYNKRVNPGKWSFAVVGTVRSILSLDDLKDGSNNDRRIQKNTEEYRRTLTREASEELGIFIKDLEQYKFLFKELVSESGMRYFISVFAVKLPLNYRFRSSADEVSQVKWLDLIELKEWLSKRSYEFTPASPYLIQKALGILTAQLD